MYPTIKVKLLFARCFASDENTLKLPIYIIIYRRQHKENDHG